MKSPDRFKFVYFRNVLKLTPAFATGKKTLYIWNGRFYEHHPEEIFKGVIADVFDKFGWEYTDNIGKEIFKQYISSCFLTEEKRAEINNIDHIVPYQNGYWNRSTQELEPYNKKYFFTSEVQCELGETAECPQFRVFLETLLPDINDQLDVLAFMSYGLSSRNDLKITQVWVGDGDNGKTTLSNFFHFAIPGFRSTVSFSTIMKGDDKEAISELAHAWTNLASELNPRGLTAEGIRLFKELTGEIIIRVRKLYEQGYNVKPKAKHLLVMNETPLPKAYCDGAFWNRIMVIVFNGKITKDQIERGIMKRLFDEEGPEICRMLMSMEHQIEKRLEKNPELAEKRWMMNTHSVFLFHQRCCVDGYCPSEELYEYYGKFCNRLSRKKESLTTFTRLLKSVGVLKTRLYDEDTREQYYAYTCGINEEKVSFLEGLQKIDEELSI